MSCGRMIGMRQAIFRRSHVVGLGRGSSCHRRSDRCSGSNHGSRNLSRYGSRCRHGGGSGGRRSSRCGSGSLARHARWRGRNWSGQRSRGHAWMRRHAIARRHHRLTGIGLAWIGLRIARWIPWLHRHVARRIAHRHLLGILALHGLWVAGRIAHGHLLWIPLRSIARRWRHKSRCVARQRLRHSWRRSGRWRVLGSWR